MPGIGIGISPVIGRRRKKAIISVYTDGTGNGENQSWKIKLPLGKSVTFDWGDGTQNTYNGKGNLDISPTHTYSSSGNYNIVCSGNCSDLTFLSCYLNNLTGKIDRISKMRNLTFLRLDDNNFSGSIDSYKVLTSLTLLYIYNNPNITGKVDNLSTLINLVNIQIQRCNLNGDFSQLRTWTKASLLVADGNNFDFDSSDAWPALNLGVSFTLKNNNMTSTQVDNAIQAFAGGPFLNTTINLSGDNAPRTSASDPYVTILENNGCTVITTTP